MSLASLRRQATAPLVLAASLAVTAWLWQHERDVMAGRRAAQIDSDLRALVGRIEQRMAAYAQVVAGMQGLYAAQAAGATTGVGVGVDSGSDPAGERRRTALHVYFESLQLGADFAGLDGAGIAAARAGAAANAAVPVLQMEPPVAGSLRWLGVDLRAAAPTRDAMEAARQSGRVALSAALPPRFPAAAGVAVAAATGVAAEAATGVAAEAATAGADGQVRVALIAAVKDAGAPPRPRAWVVAPLHIGDMMASLYGEAIPGVDIRIFDGVSHSAQSLLYDSTAAVVASVRDLAGPATSWAEAVEYLVVAGRTWTLEVRARPGFVAGAGSDRSSIIALAGSGLSLALALLTWTLATSRARAIAMAGRMTRELQDSETRYRHLAQYDELTRLPKRALLNDRLQHALAQARRERTRLALMFIDLDGFKLVNDRLGHAVGDMLLVAVARRMLHNVRESDTVARIGGDEFVVLLPAVRVDHDALGVAEKIRHALNQPFHLDGGHLATISSSTGVAFYPEHGADGQQLSASADQAMYEAKHSGRDRVSVCLGAAQPSFPVVPDTSA